jgi:hypothetical protein
MRRLFEEKYGMKNTLRFLVIALAFVSSNLNAKHPAGYTLAWSDEFNGTALDMNNWSCGTGRYPDGQVSWDNTAPWAYCSDKNITVKDGSCVIEARHETTEGPWSYGPPYTSGYLHSYNKKMAILV